jgi:hypothetical protein
MAGTATFSAICVRACAMRSARLGPADWQELLDLPTAREVVTRLASAGLVSSADLSAADAEYEIRQGLVEQASKLMRFASGDLRRTLAGFVGLYDLLNLESVICHIHGGRQGAAPRLCETGRCGMFSSAALASAGNLAVLGSLVDGTPLAVAFEEAVGILTEDGDLERCLTVLEREFVSDWRSAARAAGFSDSSALSAFLGMWVAMAVLRLGSRGGKPHELISWLRLVSDAREAQGMLERRVQPLDLHAVLMAAIFGRQSRKAEQAPQSVGQADIRAARRALARAKQAQKCLRFNADFPIGFLVTGHYQAESLIALIEGKDLGLKRAEIEALLVIS